jgi:hypothetical protein
MTTERRRAPLRLNALTVALMTKAMQEGPCTLTDLHDVCGLERPAIRRYIAAMRKVKAARIAEWEQDAIGRSVIPAFMLGDGKDKPRPPKRAGTLEHRRQRAAREAQMRMNHALAGSMEACA